MTNTNNEENKELSLTEIVKLAEISLKRENEWICNSGKWDLARLSWEQYKNEFFNIENTLSSDFYDRHEDLNFTSEIKIYNVRTKITVLRESIVGMLYNSLEYSIRVSAGDIDLGGYRDKETIKPLFKKINESYIKHNLRDSAKKRAIETIREYLSRGGQK